MITLSHFNEKRKNQLLHKNCSERRSWFSFAWDQSFFLFYAGKWKLSPSIFCGKNCFFFFLFLLENLTKCLWCDALIILFCSSQKDFLSRFHHHWSNCSLDTLVMVKRFIQNQVYFIGNAKSMRGQSSLIDMGLVIGISIEIVHRMLTTIFSFTPI